MISADRRVGGREAPFSGPLAGSHAAHVRVTKPSSVVGPHSEMRGLCSVRAMPDTSLEALSAFKSRYEVVECPELLLNVGKANNGA